MSWFLQFAESGWLGAALAGLAMMLGVFGMWLRFSQTAPWARHAGALMALIGLACLAAALPPVGRLEKGWLEQIVFWLLGSVAVAGAGASISARSPLYMAIWFAVSLLGVAGLFLFLGAQFLSVATIAVYAGAIIVTFLFALMLAQPEGTAVYDRVSWASFSAPAALLAGAVLIGLLLAALASRSDTTAQKSVKKPTTTVGDQDHMARLGSELFARHLVSVEVVGTLLMVALVGAVAMAIHGGTSAAHGRSSIRSLHEARGGRSSLEGHAGPRMEA